MEINFKQDNIKLVQITDCHFVYPMDEDLRLDIEKIMCIEKPDIVVFSGDLFYEYHNEVDSQKLINDFISFFDKFKVKYTYCFGNHDGELTILERDIYKLFLNQSEYFFGEIGSEYSTKYHPNDHHYRDERIGNFVADIKCNNEEKFKLLMLDSGRYNTKGEYGSITPNQVKYLIEQIGVTDIPIFCFFHIALEEHKVLYETNLIDGIRREADCNQTENSGFYEEFKKLNRRVYIYCGHDHINDYTVRDGNMTLGITPGLNMKPYNEENVRGYRVFMIADDEKINVKRIKDLYIKN